MPKQIFSFVIPNNTDFFLYVIVAFLPFQVSDKRFLILYSLSLSLYIYIYIYIHRVSQDECARLLEGVPYIKVYRYNPKHLCPNLNGYGDNGQRSLKL